MHTSPDGIHWKISDQRVLPLGADSANLAFNDSRLKKYVAYIRVWSPVRKVGRIETDDITKPWPFQKIEKPKYMWGVGRTPVASYEVPTVFGLDEHDPPGFGPLRVRLRPVPLGRQCVLHVSFALPALPGTADRQVLQRWAGGHPDGREPRRHRMDARVTRSLSVTGHARRDRPAWHLHMAIGMLRRGGKLFQYYTGYPFTHGAWDLQPMPSGGICSLEQRLDGFVSAEAGPDGGEFTTRPLVFSGVRLVLNVQPLPRWAVARLRSFDRQGHVAPGFSLADCDEVQGNHLEKTIRWKGKSDLSSLRGRVIGLRVVLRACKLFAFQLPLGRKG